MGKVGTAGAIAPANSVLAEGNRHHQAPLQPEVVVASATLLDYSPKHAQADASDKLPAVADSEQSGSCAQQ